ncbi:MAG TPA: TetR/AcrR family transcriptional regulator [Roseiflexaceae bacterium]|nr:TetR/AcrR family transcriptional regulator [Roseiflexaceae bacterium]HMP41556.1 TetR/AcrR family transcriptional regulator [Roseiflexaceae bacterium]
MVVSLRERRKQMLRDEILSAAEEFVGEQGYAALSMDELATRVGISKPTLYSHFATKEDLLVEAMMRGMAPLAELVEAHESYTPLAHLTLLLRTALQLQVDQRAMSLRPWTPELFGIACRNPAMLERMRHVDSIIVSQVQAAFAAGEIDPSLDPALVVRTFYALVGSLNVAHFSAAGPPDPAHAADIVAAIFERGLRRIPPAI